MTTRSATTLVETAQPELAPFGILSSAVTVHKDSTEHWIGGITYETPDANVSVRNISILGATTQKAVTAVNSPKQDNFRFYYPFSVEATIKTSTMGNDPEKVKESAREALDIVASKAISKEFWDGDIAKLLESTNANRYLAHSSATDVTPTPGTGVKVRQGLGLLVEALGKGSIGSKGVVHAPPSVVEALSSSLIEKDGGLFTKTGHGVVSGVGYSRRGPSGALATGNLAWMYATGPVTVHLGAITITPEKLNQAADIQQNNIQYFVDRPASVTWSTSNLYAVLVDLSLDYS